MGTSKILIDGVGIDLTQDTVAANKMLDGTKAHDSNGDAVTGSIQSIAAQTFNPSTTDQVIPADKYLSGAQTFKACAGTKQITENGTVDVAGFASAVVNVPSSYQEGTLILPVYSTPLNIPVEGTVSHILIYADSQHTSWSESLFSSIFAAYDMVIAQRFSASTQRFTSYSYPTTSSQYINCQFNNGSVVLEQHSLGLTWGHGTTVKWIAW